MRSFSIALPLLLVCAAPLSASAGSAASFADITCNHQGSPWYSLKVKAEIIGGDAIPGLEVSSRDLVQQGVPMETTMLSYIGSDPIVLLQPVQARFVGELAGRTAWANRIQEKMNSDNLAMLASEALRPGAFEDERSIRFFVEKFQAIPSVKMVADVVSGPGYWESVGEGAVIDLWPRKWRKIQNELGSRFDWGYDELSLFQVPDDDGRPKTVAPSPTLQVITDVGIIKGRPFFIKKTAVFSLNERYVDGTKARASDPECARKQALAAKEKENEGRSILSVKFMGMPVLVGPGVLGAALGLTFLVRRRSKVIRRRR